MSDSQINKIIQYGTNAERVAFTPDPPLIAGNPAQTLYIWYETDNAPDVYVWNGAAWVLVNTKQTEILAAEVLTGQDETATFPNSRELLPGSNITFDDTTPGERTVNAAAGGITELTGDVTAGPGTGSQVATIANDAVTFAKMQNIATDRILGRETAAAGNVEEISLGSSLFLESTTLKETKIITASVNGGGSEPALGYFAKAYIPYAITLTEAQIVADIPGDAVVDIWADTYANYPPTILDTITAAAKPTLSGVIKNKDTTLTGWTVNIPADTWMYFILDSVTDCTEITVVLKGKTT